MSVVHAKEGIGSALLMREVVQQITDQAIH